MILPLPISTRTDTLSPYTSLFRSEHRLAVLECDLASLAAVAHLHRRLSVEDDARAVGKSLGTLFTKVCGVSHRSEEHTSELQSLMRNSYAVFCLKKKK